MESKTPGRRSRRLHVYDLQSVDSRSRRRSPFLGKSNRKGVKCAQEERCFNNQADAKGGHEECDSDGEDCRAFCLFGFVYNVNEMKCKSVLLGGNDNGNPTVSTETNAKTTTTAAGLPATQGSTTVGGGLPTVPTETKVATTQGSLPVDPAIKEETPTVTTSDAAGLPEVSEVKAKGVVQEEFASSSKSSSSSSSSSSWSSNSGNAALDVDPQPKAAALDVSEAGTSVATSEAKPDTTTSTEATSAPPTSSVNASAGTTTTPSATISSKIDQAGQTIEHSAQAGSSALPVEPAPTSKAEAGSQEASDQKHDQTAVSSSSSSHTSASANANEEQAVAQTSKDQISKDQTADHDFAEGGETKGSSDESTHDNVDEGSVTEETIEAEDTEDSAEGEEAEDHEAEDHDATSSEIKSEQSSHSSSEGVKGEISSSKGIAALGDQGRLASWEKSLGTATSGLTPKEKTAIGGACAGIAVFVILLVFALLNRDKLIKVIRRRSSGRESLSSQASLTLSDWEKMDQGIPPSTNTVKSSGKDELNGETGPGISGWTGFKRQPSQQSPQGQSKDAYAPSTHRIERDNEELGYDWLELATEGRADGLSPNTILQQQQQQSRFSSSPRKRSFVAQSIISSPGIIAKAFRIIVPDDKLKSTPAMAEVPVSKKKGKLTGLLKLPNGIRSPPARSPLGPSARKEGQDAVPNKASPVMTDTSSPLRAGGSPKSLPRTPGPHPQAVRNPFEEVADVWNSASDYADNRPYLERQGQLSYAVSQPGPHMAGRQLAPVQYQPQGVQIPMEIDYVSPSAPRSSVSESSSGSSQRSLALPGAESPPRTPMTAARIPVPSLLSEPDTLYGQSSDVHHSLQRTMDFRQLPSEQNRSHEETFPEDEELEGQIQSVGGYFVPTDHGQSSHHESWFTRSSAEPPSLLDAVPITQEEVRKSRSRNTVRFAEV